MLVWYLSEIYQYFIILECQLVLYQTFKSLLLILQWNISLLFILQWSCHACRVFFRYIPVFYNLRMSVISISDFQIYFTSIATKKSVFYIYCNRVIILVEYLSDIYQCFKTLECQLLLYQTFKSLLLILQQKTSLLYIYCNRVIILVEYLSDIYQCFIVLECQLVLYQTFKSLLLILQQKTSLLYILQ